MTIKPFMPNLTWFSSRKRLAAAPAIAASATSPIDWLSLVFGVLTLVAGSLAGTLVSQVSNPTMAWGVMLALGVMVMTIASANAGLLFLVMMTYTRFSDVLIKEHGLPSTAQPFILLLGLGIIVRWAWMRTQPKGWQRSLGLVTLYGLIGALSLFYAGNYTRSRTALEDYFKDAVIAILVTILLQRGTTLQRVSWALLATGIFMGTISVWQHLTENWSDRFYGFGIAAIQNIVGETSGYRIAGPIGDPNFYAQILIVLVPLALDRLWNERRAYLRVLAAWALAVCILSIFFTYSRGGFIGMVIVLALMFWRRPPRLIVLLLTVAIAIPILQFLPDNYTARLRTIPEALPFWGSDVRNEISFRGRASENIAAWQMFFDHPILGVGLDNYPVLYQDYSRQLGMDPRREIRAPHNLYLEIASQTGLLGLLTFAYLLWVMFRGLRQARHTFDDLGQKDYAGIAAALMIGMIGYLWAAIFLHGAYPRYFWLLFGIALAIPQVAQFEKAARLKAQHEPHGDVSGITV
jgi:O-antigen ligase